MAGDEIRVYYNELNMFLITSFLLIGLGAVKIGCLFQNYSLRFNYYGLMVHLNYYVLSGLMIILTVIALKLIGLHKEVLGWHISKFSGKIGFLKPIRREVLRTYFLGSFFEVVKKVELGWIRGY